MRFQLALSWRLAIYVGLISLGVMVVVLLSNQSQLKGFDEALGEAMSVRAADNARALGRELPGLVEDQEKLGSRLTDFLSENEQTFALVVLDKDRNDLAKAGEAVDTHRMLTWFDTVDKAATIEKDDKVVAVFPLTEKSKVGIVGYLLLVESKDHLNANTGAILWLQFIFLALGTLLAGGIAFIIGRQVAQPIVEISKAATAISEGHLGEINFQVSSGTLETKQLAASVQKMTETFRSQINSIKELINNIYKVSKDASSAMAHLASSAAEQAAAVSETASTVEEMEQAGKSAAGNANEIVEASGRTTEVSIRGRQAVETTSRIILQIKDSSQEISEKSKNLLASVEEIGNIISSVNAIAEQSKILAVNASIEAAKAGEYGVGFAVVAQEVKELAQQSKEATLEITGTLTAIRQAIELMVDTAQSGAKRTEDGVKMVGNAGAIVNDLSEAIRENSEFANVIATNVSQQSLGLTQIAAAIDQINSTALENQEITKKVEESTKTMTVSLDQLTEIIQVWRTENIQQEASTS